MTQTHDDEPVLLRLYFVSRQDSEKGELGEGEEEEVEFEGREESSNYLFNTSNEKVTGDAVPEYTYITVQRKLYEALRRLADQNDMKIPNRSKL